jgi:8-oxo-dGTP diphosphatase
VELGETIAEAACRELAEETGVVAEAGAVAEVLTIIARDADGAVKNHYVAAVVRMTWLGGEPVPASDAVEANWFTLSDIAGMVCHPDLARLAKEALRP